MGVIHDTCSGWEPPWFLMWRVPSMTTKVARGYCATLKAGMRNPGDRISPTYKPRVIGRAGSFFIVDIIMKSDLAWSSPFAHLPWKVALNRIYNFEKVVEDFFGNRSFRNIFPFLPFLHQSIDFNCRVSHSVGRILREGIPNTHIGTVTFHR